MKLTLRHIILSLAAALVVAVPAVAADTSSQTAANVASQEVEARPGTHCINISVPAEAAPADVAIYAITGQLVKQLSLAEGHTAIDMDPGYYIVRVGKISKRVVVK